MGHPAAIPSWARLHILYKRHICSPRPFWERQSGGEKWRARRRCLTFSSFSARYHLSQWFSSCNKKREWSYLHLPVYSQTERSVYTKMHICTDPGGHVNFNSGHRHKGMQYGSASSIVISRKAVETQEGRRPGYLPELLHPENITGSNICLSFTFFNVSAPPTKNCNWLLVARTEQIFLSFTLFYYSTITVKIASCVNYTLL